MDLGFLHRVYRTSTLVWGFFTLWCLAYRPLADALSLSAGYLLGLASWKGTELAVRALLEGGARRPPRWLTWVALGKLLLLGAALWLLLQLPGLNAIALALGVLLIPTVAVLKAIGWQLTRSPGATEGNGGTSR